MNDSVIKVFIGYDPVESVAWHTMAHSILRKCSRPVALIPVNIENMKHIFTRERDPKQSNSFLLQDFWSLTYVIIQVMEYFLIAT